MRRIAFALLALASLAACGGDSPTSPGNSVAGTYNLQTYNGNQVPAVVYQDSQETIEITSAYTNLNADGTYSSKANFRDTQGQTVTTTSSTDAGVYEQNGNTLVLTSYDNTAVVAPVIGTSLSITNSDGDVMVFKK